MATKVGVLVERVRSMLEGGLGDVRSVLDADYTAGADTMLHLRYAQTSIQAGTMISAGLGTFYVLATQNGKDLEVLPSADGGDDVDVPKNTVVRIRPRYPTSAIFRAWCSGLQRLSAPLNGLYGYGSFTGPADPVSGVYFLPEAWGDKRPLKLLVARYHMTGTTAWQTMSAEWQLDQNAVRVYGPQPVGTTVEFVFAFPYQLPAGLDTDAEECGLNEWTLDIPGLYAASELGRTLEGRRNQLRSQGDSRRSAEVPAGANLGVSRDWRADANRRVDEEASRLIQEFGYVQLPVARDTPANGAFL